MPRILVLVGGFFLSCFGGFVVLNLLPLPQGVASVWIMVHVLTMPVWFFGLDRKWGLTLLSHMLPRTHLVRTVDHDHEIRYVLAYGEPGQVLTGHIYWLAQMGHLKLYPNGYVAGASYVYFWEPVDVDTCTHMHLTYDCVDWSKLKHMTWHEVEEYRFKLRNQAKLMHVTHI